MRTVRFKVTTAVICPYIVFTRICMLHTILTTESKRFIILDVPKILGQM